MSSTTERLATEPAAPHPQIASGQAAQAAALAAATKSGVQVRDLDGVDHTRDAARLLSRVWRTTLEAAPVPADLLRGLGHAGGYVAGAYAAAELVGVSVGFFSDGEHRGLHSHVAGVRPDWQGRSVGFALKQHQRAWAMERGIKDITWTFDPLMRRNAFFNLSKLGATVLTYLPNFYGPMMDGLNAGDDSDRLLVRWQLGSPEVAQASVGNGVEVALDGSVADRRAVVLGKAADGEPLRRTASGDRVLCWIPEDIETVRATAPELAQRWRRALRHTMQETLADGYEVAGVTRDGWYLLQKSETT